MAYAELPPTQPVAVKRMGAYIIITQRTLHEQPDMLMVDEKVARDLIKQLQALTGDV